MGFFDSSSTTITPTQNANLSGTLNALGSGYQNLTGIATQIAGSGNYSPDYSFSTISVPTVNSTTNLSLQLASGSPGASFANSQTASQNSIWQWVLAAGVVIFSFYLYHKYR